MNALPDHFLGSRDFMRISRAIRFIDTHFQAQPRLETIAAHVGLSAFHFNRLFRRWAGLTPKQYLTWVTGSAARQALVRESSVLQAAYAVGLSGPGRLHDLVVTLEALTPGELKVHGAGVTICWGFSDTPFGTALIAQTGRGICHLAFVDVRNETAAQAELQPSWPRARYTRDDEQAREAARRIWGSGDVSRHPLHLTASGTNFQVKVWQALLALGVHERTTYQDLARAIGAEGSARAVGGAVGANRIAWLIPCHHVLRKGGAPGGYRWGEDRKLAMLAWESMAPRRRPGPDVGAPDPNSARIACNRTVNCARKS